MRLSVLQGLATSGRHVNLLWNAIKHSFETANNLVGFAKAPHYQLVKYAPSLPHPRLDILKCGPVVAVVWVLCSVEAQPSIQTTSNRRRIALETL